MRLTRTQIETILRAVGRMAGSGVRVMLFGSRLDDAARGGDLDLLIEAERRPTLIQQSGIKSELEAALAMPVDIVTISSGAAPTPFQGIALARAVELGVTT